MNRTRLEFAEAAWARDEGKYWLDEAMRADDARDLGLVSGIHGSRNSVAPLHGVAERLC